MKTVYFVRHGESEGNAGTIRLGYEGGLTERGKKQAEALGDRCARLPLDAIVSSTVQRARETTEFIYSKIPTPPLEYSELFVERRSPSGILGLVKGTPEELHIVESIWTHFGEPGWRFSDEENFDDLNERARKALDYLRNHPNQQILVSTHGVFIRILLARAVFGEQLDGHLCNAIMKTFRTENSGINVLKWRDDRNRWEVLIWNDHDHLG